MDANRAERLLGGGHSVIVANCSSEPVAEAVSKGAVACIEFDFKNNSIASISRDPHRLIVRRGETTITTIPYPETPLNMHKHKLQILNHDPLRKRVITFAMDRQGTILCS